MLSVQDYLAVPKHGHGLGAEDWNFLETLGRLNPLRYALPFSLDTGDIPV